MFAHTDVVILVVSSIELFGHWKDSHYTESISGMQKGNNTPGQVNMSQIRLVERQVDL